MLLRIRVLQKYSITNVFGVQSKFYSLEKCQKFNPACVFTYTNIRRRISIKLICNFKKKLKYCHLQELLNTLTYDERNNYFCKYLFFRSLGFFIKAYALAAVISPLRICINLCKLFRSMSKLTENIAVIIYGS